ncbi:hypothetical protein AM493_01165 [Flavobacterium akiainvivens]|uniref:Uncharacterized protein n=1 Tax=Flavobacterium akiainvivens TaxID=1202724 RepID=A0A0N0RQC6_9FLAO|nr:hypothetical protein [Flavobacterium akiainvivens]KOS04806.1 hypothetical protein AM493_01165 [Flavobacterium akiainvivens]SFQ43903.1 hypothetical protein SAMN05444144_104294 [Flavobacterium akiainvivens]
MAKLYIFGIGGTGSRVIKALTMLLATGVDINGFEVVPVIIDPDEANGDVSRTTDILKNYQHIHNNLSFTGADDNKFFKTKISSICQNFKLVLSEVKGERFKDYIEYNSLDENNKALISLLFSEDNLEADMEVGFKGNPNIGSVVLNQFKQSQDFKAFASSFAQNDRIFIISSIFGGTGASGFPLLLKNIRNADASLPSAALLRDAPVGAITLLPYFGVSPSEESKIDKSSFISKTKAALSYYEENVSGNSSLNALYYAGDDITKDHPNHEGAAFQKNDAHFLELAAALAIIDFSAIPATALVTTGGKAENPVYKEFGIKDNAPSIIFENLGFTSQFILKKPLTQYLFFALYCTSKMQDCPERAWAKKINLQAFLTQPFVHSYLRTFNQYFLEWLTEMGNNQRGFSPFNLNANDNNLFEIVKGIKPDSGIFELNKNYNKYDHMLDKVEKSLKNNDSQQQRFMNLFYNTTETLVSEKYKF